MGPDERLDFRERQLRGYIEDSMVQSSASGGVVIGRRGGMVVLAGVPWALHVYLGGPRDHDARMEQWMALEGVYRKSAEHRQ